MWNEFLFFAHVFLVLTFLFIALRLGRGALFCFVAIGGILANLLVTKQMEFFHLTVTCTDVFMIQAILALNLLQEFYGKQSARKATTATFLCMIFFAIMSQVHLLYTPSVHDTMQPYFMEVLQMTPRIVCASMVVFFTVQRLDIFLFSVLQKTFQSKYLPLRIAISLVFTQFLDTVLFSFVGLYGLVHSMIDIIIVSFIVKLILIFCSTPFTVFAKKIHKGLVHEI